MPPHLARSALHGRRIVFMLSSLELGGAERQALLVATGLADKFGANVEVLGLHGGEAVGRHCLKAGLPCRALGPIRNGGRALPPATLAKLILVLRRARPMAVLGYTHHANVAGGLACKAAGVPLFIWGQRDMGSVRTWRLAEQAALRAAAGFVANSAAGADFLIGAMRVDPRRVHVIPNGLALDEPLADRAAWRQQLGLEAEQPAVCMLGNLTSLKDHATLLRAWRLVLDGLEGAGPTPSLILAGRWGECYPAIQQLVTTLGLETAVQLPGYVDDVPGLLEACDLAVLSSRAEGLPNGVIEPMAYGLAVVATNTPGSRAAIGTANVDWLVPVGDSEALAARLLRLLTAPELRLAVGQANRTFARVAFSAQAAIDSYADLLRCYLAESERAGRRRQPV